MLRKFTILAAMALGVTTPAKAENLDFIIAAGAAVDAAPIFAGIERGIFDAHGLNARIESYQTGVDMVNGLLNGAQHVNMMGSVPYLSGVSRGFPLTLIGHGHGDASRGEYTDNQSIVASAASGVAAGDISGLKNKRIGLPRGSGAEGYLLGNLAALGISEAEVELVNINPAELVTALNQGDIDALAIWEPWGSTAMTKVEGAVRVKQGGCESCYDPGTLLTTPSIIADNSEELQRFIDAFAEAQQWVRQNPTEAADINMRWIQGVDKNTMNLAITTPSYDMRLSKNTVDGYANKSIPALLSLGKIENSFDPAPAVDATFVNNTMDNHPEFFSDLPALDGSLRLE